MTILNVQGDLNGTLDTSIGSPTPQPISIQLDAVTYDKMQLETRETLLGNPNGTVQNPQEIPIGPGLEFINGTLNVIGFAYSIDATVSTNENDWTPTGLGSATVVRMDATSYVTISGITGGTNGRILILENDGTMPVKLTNQDSNSGTANQFGFNRNVFLSPNDSVQLIYDESSDLWKLTTKEKDTDSEFYGSGFDGDFTMSGGTLTLTRDMYYRNLTITGGTIYTNGWKIFVSEMLDITNAPSNAIRFAPQAMLDGQVTEVIQTTAGTFTIINWPQGHTVGAGSPGISAGTRGHHSSGGNGGLGGNTPGTSMFEVPVYRFGDGIFQSILGGCGGSQDPTGLSGAGGGIVFISARFINRGTNGNSSIISSTGGTGVNGGGGGWVFLCYGTLFGSTISGALNAAGGEGILPGAGGYGGRITIMNLTKDSATEAIGGANSGTIAGGCSADL